MLTEHERQYLELTATGMSAAEIGDAIGYVPRSIHNLSHRTCQKLGVRNRVAAVAVALKRGWIEGPEVSA